MNEKPLFWQLRQIQADLFSMKNKSDWILENLYSMPEDFKEVFSIKERAEINIAVFMASERYDTVTKLLKSILDIERILKNWRETEDRFTR